MLASSAVKERAAVLGADLCGIAPVARFAQAPAGFHPCDIYPGTQSVIVVACRFPASTLEANTNCPYTLVRNVLANKVDNLTCDLAVGLEQAGAIAVPIPSSEPYEHWEPERRHGRGILSLKHAAVLAGLGVMGKNTLLVNEAYGNLVWLGAVLTSAELEPDPPATYQPCPPNCRICLDACPQQALDGTTVDQLRCRERAARCSEGGGSIYACNICRKVCPRRAGLRSAR